VHFASLGRAFRADGRGFSPIEGGLEGGGSALELGSLTRLMADLLPFLHRQDPIFRKSPENLQKNCR